MTGPTTLKPYQHPDEAALAPSVQECLRVELQSLGEIPDRTSPDDFPDGYVLTRHEIVTSILAVVLADRAARAEVGTSHPELPRLIERAEDTLKSQGQQEVGGIQVLNIHFWRARAVYLAEAVLRCCGPSGMSERGPT